MDMNMKFLFPIILLTGSVLSACSTQPEKHAVLDMASSDYAQAQGDPDVTNYAAIELQQAGDALDKATDAQRKGEDQEVVDHLAYVAAKKVAIAQETAKMKVAEKAVANISTEREKIRLELRTTEADSARQQVKTAKERAERQETALEVSQAQTESSRQRLEAQVAETDSANVRIHQMEEELKELNARETERGMVITLGDVLFDTSKAELRDSSINSLKKLADFLKAYPERTAVIEGYTDSTGESSFNQSLSEKRAMAVRDSLLNMGVDRNRISTRGFGEANPVATNTTAAGRQSNRRVEIVLPQQQ
ncbi:OmpA family protein [Thiohalophilus sp.]|uniref:OmpA family protein n=1 Tax=Thiohalophilus sp. TaxID=3028392 RepID=UPI002ACE9457|nr:OmpA family protein [Thiohalophilus sp.]MDZ7805337.1 OmpA family protein [Thiohalophilus sp.]